MSADRIISFVLNWKRKQIQCLLEEYLLSSGTNLSVDSILTALYWPGLSDELGLISGELYREMSKNFTQTDLIHGFSFIFQNDPSRSKRVIESVEECFNEKPFSRYVVSLSYHIVCWCMDFTLYEIKDAIWSNILLGNLLHFPRHLSKISEKIFTREELVDRSIRLLGSEDKDINFIGETLIYMENLSYQEIISSLKRNFHQEVNTQSKKKYKKYMRRYFYLYLQHLLCNLIFPNFDDMVSDDNPDTFLIRNFRIEDSSENSNKY